MHTIGEYRCALIPFDRAGQAADQPVSVKILSPKTGQQSAAPVKEQPMIDELVKPSWIRKLGDAQQIDGGWSHFEPLLPLGGGRYFGYGQKIFAIKQPLSSFHMTAQGILLFSLLTSR